MQKLTWVTSDLHELIHAEAQGSHQFLIYFDSLVLAPVTTVYQYLRSRQGLGRHPRNASNKILSRLTRANKAIVLPVVGDLSCQVSISNLINKLHERISRQVIINTSIFETERPRVDCVQVSDVLCDAGHGSCGSAHR